MSTLPRYAAGVKINISNWKPSKGIKLVWNCGQAVLYRMRDGRFELHGGSHAERIEAYEIASLFDHHAVFDPTCPAQRPERN